MAPTPDPDRELAELREYLREDFDEDLLRGHTEAVASELRAVGDEATLYRTSTAYLYDLAVFATWPTKRPYREVLTRAVAPPARLLDLGCGIGSDGLALLEAGYEVHFADFDNPSTRYLRWRLERRGLRAPVYDLDAGALPTGFDLAYAFDVIEHVPDPFAFLATMERSARRVLVNLLEPVPGDLDVHHDLPIRALLRHVARRRLRHHRRYHGRSHLVLYDARPARGLHRLRSAAVLHASRAYSAT